MLVRKRGERGRSSRSRVLRITNVILAVFLCPISAWDWGNDGHEIVAINPADNLTHAAPSHVASILGVSTDRIAAAMEEASVRSDSEFPEEERQLFEGA
jgi:hypothetical protein